MKAPSKEEVINHFLKAKEIRCPKQNSTIGVTGVKEFEFNEGENAWTSVGELIVFWKDGIYSEITRKKCNPEDCKNCKPCSEKRKFKNK